MINSAPLRDSDLPRQKTRDWNQIETLAMPILTAASTFPLFSVCIVVRDRPVLLQKAVASVLMGSCQDYELIIVDDGSAVPVKEILNPPGFLVDQRVRVIRQPPSGIAPARNLALHAARGVFVTVLDSDDELTPDALLVLHDFIAKTGSHWVYADYREIVEGQSQLIRLPEYASPGKMLHGVLTRPRLPFKHSGMTIRRELLLEIGGYDEELPLFEDIELMLRGLRAGIHPRRLPHAIVRFHRHDDNITRQRRLLGIGVWFQLINLYQPNRIVFVRAGLKMFRAMSEIGKWLVRIGG